MLILLSAAPIYLIFPKYSIILLGSSNLAAIALTIASLIFLSGARSEEIIKDFELL